MAYIGQGPSLVIWDWNGTLQDDAAYVYECGVQRIFKTYGLPCPTIDEYKDEVKADFMLFYHGHGIPPEVTAEDLNKIMYAGFKEKGSPAPVFPDALEAVAQTRRLGYLCALVSGYSSSKLVEAVRRNGFERHLSPVIGDVRDKPAAFREVMAKHGAAPELTFVVGDTTEDAEAAREVGATPFICPRGFHTRHKIESLYGAVPRLIVIATLRELLCYLP